MIDSDEQAMHEVAKRLASLTEGTGWEAMRYMAIGRAVEELTTFCAVCDCQKRKKPAPRGLVTTDGNDQTL